MNSQFSQSTAKKREKVQFGTVKWDLICKMLEYVWFSSC